MKKVATKIILSVSFFVVLHSCSDRYKALAELDKEPEIRFVKDAATYSYLKDSCKFFPNSYYNLQVSIRDTNQNLQKLEFESIPNDSKLYVGHVEYTHSIPIDYPLFHINILPSKIGTEHYTFTLTDRFNKTDVAELDLVTFANLPPVALFDVNEIRQNDPLEYELDGSASFDSDAKFGGKIVEYKWIINNADSISSLAPKIRYIFPQQGLFKIDLKVKDNEGAVTTLTKYANIN